MKTTGFCETWLQIINSFQQRQTPKIKSPRRVVLALFNHWCGACLQSVRLPLTPHTRKVGDCWKSLFRITENTIFFKEKVFWQLETFSIRRAIAVNNCVLVVTIRPEPVIRFWKLFWTLISQYERFLAISAYCCPFSRLFWHFSKNLVSEPHRNFRKRCRSGNRILRLKLPRRAPQMIFWWHQRCTLELYRSTGGTHENPAPYWTFRLF